MPKKLFYVQKFVYLRAVNPIQYIIESERDLLWGLSVCSVGFQHVEAGAPYPPRHHAENYLFNPLTGRVLQEYQLLYITRGQGVLETTHAGEQQIDAGTMFLIFPDEWHSYHPDPDTGWDTRQEAYFQQLLCGIVNHLLGLMFMTSINLDYDREREVPELISRARDFMQRNIEDDISMPDVASALNVSYTTFRRLFKRYTGLAPSQYFINLRLHRAKQLLRSTDRSIKEISFRLHFENPEYFATLFKKRTGMRPSDFRA